MSTWDEQEPAPPAPVPAPITEQPAADTPEGETLSTEAATEVESPAVEGEAPKEPEAETPASEDDEIVREDIALADIDTKFSNSNAGARAYMKRLTQKVDDAKSALEFEDKYLSAVPADTLLSDLAEKSESRYADLGWGYWGAHKDTFLQKEFGMTSEDIQKLKEGAPQREPAQPTHEYDEDDVLDLPDWAQKALAENAQMKQELSGLNEKVPTLERDVASFKTTQEQQQQAIEETARQEIRTGLFNTVETHAAEWLENSGLKALDSDTPEVKNYIEMVAKELSNRLFFEFDQRPQYKEDTATLEDAIQRRDAARVNRLLPKIKVATELVLDEISKHHKAAVKAMRSPAKQETKPRPEITGTTPSFAPSSDVVRGKGVDAVWGT